MLGQIVTIARNSFVESVRQPIYFILIVIVGKLLFLSTWTTAFTMGYSASGEVSADNKLLLDVGVATVFVGGMLLAAFIATAVVSREIEDKTVLTVISKPISRTAIVLGKYLGVAGAMIIACGTMLLFLQMAIRHGVMATASDELDWPVILFSYSAVFMAIGLGIWTNFFYGWSFTQVSTLLMFPFMIVAWVLVMFLDHEWHWQPFLSDFKPQVTIASLTLVLSQLVFTAIATAASARLGQVMTIVVCAGLFLFGLLSNHFIGRHVYDNEFAGRIVSAQSERPEHADLDRPGERYRIEFAGPPRIPLEIGTPILYGISPNGSDIAVRGPVATGAVGIDPEDWLSSDLPEQLIVAEIGEVRTEGFVLERVGDAGQLRVIRPPAIDDYVFIRSTQMNYATTAIWGIVPNVQFFWLVDAVTENQPIPGSHLLLITLYSIAQIGVFLSLTVILFQRREVG